MLLFVLVNSVYDSQIISVSFWASDWKIHFRMLLGLFDYKGCFLNHFATGLPLSEKKVTCLQNR